MYAIEFEGDVQNGIIKTPDTYKELNSQHSKVIILFDDSDMLCQPEKNQKMQKRACFRMNILMPIGTISS